MAMAAAIANLEVRYGGDEGLVVRTGWNRAGEVTLPPFRLPAGRRSRRSTGAPRPLRSIAG